jgi:hypothetical protein
MSLRTRLLVFLALAPLLIFLSFPASFLYGGVLLALLPEVRREGRWLQYGGVALAVGVSFLLLALGPARAQKDVAMVNCWLNFFPDWSRPWTIPGWILISTGEVYRYCLPPLGQALAAIALVGLIALWRQHRRDVVVLLAVPGLLALAASFLGSYPYGGARVMVYAAPALSLLVAAGAPLVLDWLRPRGRLAMGGVIVLLLLPLGASLARLVRPWDRAQTDAACAWVLERRNENDLVLGNDWTCFYYMRHLGERFQPTREVPNAEPPRTWVVYIGRIPVSQRLDYARARAPQGWQVVEHREFHNATVVLLAE